MPQSNVIFFYVFAAFFVFITLRGELPKYMGFLLASPKNSNLRTDVFGNQRTDSLGQVSGSPLASNSGPDFAKIAQVASFFG